MPRREGSGLGGQPVSSIVAEHTMFLPQPPVVADRRALGPRFLIRDAAGHLFGLFERGADASHFYAVPLARTTVDANPLEPIQFLITDRGLGVG